MPSEVQPTPTVRKPTPTRPLTIEAMASPIEKVTPTGDVFQPSLAGSWYPADAEQLAAEVDGYLDAVRSIDGAPYVLIVPQIQYAFSGKIGASAYIQLQNAPYDCAIILATAVYPPRPEPIAVWEEGAFETPLGRVEVDQAMAKAIIAADPLVKSDKKVFQAEPGIEIQLPFLQRVCPHCRIVPILIDDKNDDYAVKTLAKVLSEVWRKDKMVLIAGSNLSEYPSQQDGMSLDDKIMGAIETGNPSVFSDTVAQCLASNIPNLETCAYGETAIMTAINTANLLGAETVSLMNYGNSGNSPNGDPSRVTGYGSVMFWHYEAPDIPEEHRNILLSLARDTLTNNIDHQQSAPIEVDDALLQRKSGAFVVLKLDGKVRGSMGHMRADLPISEVIREMSLAALTSNPRLAVLSPEDRKRLKIEISITSPPQRLKSVDDIVLGKQGLLIQERNHQGVLLPQVQVENQWGRFRYLDHVCLVAGLAENCWKNGVVIYSFTTVTFSE